jgi:dynein heavy chain
MIIVRHGLMLVGYSYGMKTASIRVLAAALADLHAAGKHEEITCCRMMMLVYVTRPF